MEIRIKVSLKHIPLLLVAIIFAIFLQYLKKEGRHEVEFLHEINKPFYKLIHGYILVSMASLTQSNQSTQQQIQMQLSKKHITFSQFLAPFLKSKSNLEHFPKKHGPLAYIFPELRVRKTCLNKCLKSTAFEQTSTVNMLKGSKYYLNLHDSIFIILFHHSGGN